MTKLINYIKQVFFIDRYVENFKKAENLQSRFVVQLITAAAFLLLTITNIIAKSYLMLALTAVGGVVNLVFAFVAKKRGNSLYSSISAVITCSLLFGFFVVYGGNDGFACLWCTLLPFLSMVVMSFKVGLCVGMLFEVFLMSVFWTPIKDMIFYQYNAQFCLRFPLFFLVTFSFGFALTIALRRSEYNECKHLEELKELNDASLNLARIDPLTKLANRRFAYEEFEKKFCAEGEAHCIVMGDIDFFKMINDTYGHQFGDDVLVVFAQKINEVLPSDYLKCRWGGEEFLFAANADKQVVFEQIEKLRQQISEIEFTKDGNTFHITITFGIAEYASLSGINAAISEADKNLYLGKNTKNCTIV